MKIKTKVLVIVCTLVLIAGAVTILINEIVSKNMIEHQVYNHLQTAAQSRVNHIESVLEEQKELTKAVSAGNHFRDVVVESKDHNQGMEQVKRRIKSIIEVHDEISQIRVLDKNGIVVASSHADIGFDESAADIFLKGKEGVHAGDVHIFASTGNRVMSVSAPILLNGEFSGVIVINFDAEKGLFEITTDRTGLGENGEMYLVNKDGYMITPSRFVNDTFLMQKIDTEHKEDLLRQIEIFGAQEHGDKAELYKNYLGTDVLGVHTHIPEMDWCLIAEISEAEAFAPIAELRSRMLPIIVLILIMSVAFSTVLSGTIAKPIVKLHRGTEEIEKGNLDYKVGTDTGDEIGQLSRAFDSMTAQLKESREELEAYGRGLEEKVKERTEELAAANDKLERRNNELTDTKAMLQQDIAEQEILHKNIEETNRKLVVKAKEAENARRATLNITEDIEKAKQEAENAKSGLQESEGKLRAIVESAKDSIFVKDHELRYVMVNQAMERLFELPAGKLLGKSDAELVCEEAGQHIEDVDSRVLQGETIENVHSKPVGGEMKTFHTVKVPLRDASGKISGLCGIARDVTEQKKVEERERRIAELDKLHGEVSDIFLKEHSIETGAEFMLEKTGNFMGVCRTYIFHYSEDGKTMSNVYEWCAEDVTPQIDNLQQVPVDVVPYWIEELSQNHVIQTSDITSLPQEERDILEPQGIKSILSVPIFVNKKLFGFFGFDETRYHREWHREEIATLRGIADAYASVMERMRAGEELRKYNVKLERFNRLAVGRESKMIELKKELNGLYERLGEKTQYRIASEDSSKIANEELGFTGGEKGC